MGKNNKAKLFYDPDLQRSLAGIPLPPKLKCDRCANNLGHNSFAQKHLTEARMLIKQKGVHAKITPRCRRCAGTPIVEIECNTCSETKGIKEFAKSQRTKPDNAKCFACVEKQLEIEPINEEVYEGNLDHAFIPPDYSAGRAPDYWSSTKSSHSTASEADCDPDDDEYGGISLDRAFHQMSFTNSTAGTLISVTDETYSVGSRGGPGGPVRSASNGYALYGSVSASSTYRSDVSNFANRSETQYKAGGFAKIKAYKPEKPAPPPEEEDWKSDSEDDDDGLDTDSDDDAEI